MDERRGRLSRFLALVLRHQGPDMGLKFDEDGFTDLDGLVALLKTNEVFGWAGLQDVEVVIGEDSKGRYEIRDGRIRAKYGHSEKIPVTYEETDPPEKLYHGTTGQATRDIEKNGITPQGRRYVHLSLSEPTAFNVARRHTSFPVILEIDAAQAHKDGVKFYKPSEHIFLVEKIPPQYLRVCEVKRNPTPQTFRQRSGPPPPSGR